MKKDEAFISGIEGSAAFTEGREEAEGEISDDAVEVIAGGNGDDSGESGRSRRNPHLPLMTREEIYETYGGKKQH